VSHEQLSLSCSEPKREVGTKALTAVCVVKIANKETSYDSSLGVPEGFHACLVLFDF